MTSALLKQIVTGECHTNTITRKSIASLLNLSGRKSQGVTEGCKGKGNVPPSLPHPQTIRYQGRGWDGSQEIALVEV